MAAWLRTLKQWFKRSPAISEPGPDRGREEGDNPGAPAPTVIGEHGAAHGGDDPEALHYGRRRLKETYTSHWDLDYLPREEVERIAEENEKKH